MKKLYCQLSCNFFISTGFDRICNNHNNHSNYCHITYCGYNCDCELIETCMTASHISNK